MPSTIAEYLGVPARFAEFVDLGRGQRRRHGLAGRRRDRTRHLRCGAVRAAGPLHHPDVGEEAQAAGRRDVLRIVEQPIRLPASGIRDPVRQPRPERPLWPGRYTLRGGLRLRRAGDGQDRRRPAGQCQPHRRRHLERQAAHRRGRAGQPGDRRPAAHAGDRHALRRRRRGRGRQCRHRQTGANRPVWIKGFGEHVPFKTPTYAEDLLDTPIAEAADTALRHDRI